MTQKLFFDLRCNRCGHYFEMPLKDMSCPRCDEREAALERKLLYLKHAALTVQDLWRLGTTDADLWSVAKESLRNAVEEASK